MADILSPSFKSYSQETFISEDFHSRQSEFLIMLFKMEPKANGNICLCEEYKITVNKYTQKDVYKPPRLEYLFPAWGGGVVFSKLDLTSAYQHIPLDEESKSTQSSIHIKDYFIMNNYIYLSKYQLLHQYLYFTRVALCCAYLNDILIIGADEQDHLANLNQVLNCLKTAGLTIHHLQRNPLNTKVT